MSNPLLEIIESPLDHTIHKWLHYLPLYHRHFEKYKLKANTENKIHILEIGVQNGGSLEMWNRYFGQDNCVIYGLDIDPRCKLLEQDNINIFIGDQGNSEFLQKLKEQIPQVDILIDDGGHTMVQQITTFEVLYEHVKLGGIYLCEDTHTSYDPYYGGGLDNPKSFMEYSKNIIDYLNTHYNGLAGNYFAKTCLGIHFYDSMVFFEKADGPLEKPYAKIWHRKSL